MRHRLAAVAAVSLFIVGAGVVAAYPSHAADVPTQQSLGWQASCTTNSAGVCSLPNQSGSAPEAVTLTLRNTFAQAYLKSATASTITVQVIQANKTVAYVGVAQFDVHVDYTAAGPTTPPAATPTTSPTTPPTTAPTTPPAGGDWPNSNNTGVPAGTTLTAYTGPCTITVAGTVIDSKTVNCDLEIKAAGVVIKNSKINGEVNNDGTANQAGPGAGFAISDSQVVNGKRDACACVGFHDFTATRVEVIGGNRGMYCERRCTISDSYVHGTNLKYGQHASAIRVEQYSTLTHNTMQCDWTAITDPEIGCSADMTGYADFAPITHNTIERNLFVANAQGIGYCSYGGATKTKPYSNDPANATYIVFRDNTWQRGSTKKCGQYGPITDWDGSRTGNVWSGNVWDDGAAVNPN